MLTIFALAILSQDAGYYRVSETPPAFIEAGSISVEGDVVSFVQVVMLPENQADLPVAFEVDTQVNCATSVHRSTEIREVMLDNSTGRTQTISRGWRERTDDVGGWFELVCNDRDGTGRVEGSRQDLIAPLVEARRSGR